MIELTKEKVLEVGKITAKVHDKARGGYYEIRPISKPRLAVILQEAKITMKQLREGIDDLAKMEDIEERIIQASLKGWTPKEVKEYFPSDMKEPVALAVLQISNLGVSTEKLDEFFLNKPPR